MSHFLWDYQIKESHFRRRIVQRSVAYEGIGSIPNARFKKVRNWEEKPSFPLNKHLSETQLEKILLARRTRRTLSDQDMTFEFIEKLLMFTVGLSDSEQEFMTYPSPGATYPTQVFLCTGFSNAVYRYNPFNHALEIFSTTQGPIIRSAIGDEKLKAFPLILFLATDYQLVEEKYGPLSFRLINQEMGHMAQNISLYAEQERFNSVCVGGFYQKYFKEVVGETFDLHYVITVG